jgi:hypothetical protein
VRGAATWSSSLTSPRKRFKCRIKCLPSCQCQEAARQGVRTHTFGIIMMMASGNTTVGTVHRACPCQWASTFKLHLGEGLLFNCCPSPPTASAGCSRICALQLHDEGLVTVEGRGRG